MFKVEAVVVGAGVIGLAIARALALRGVQVLLLEKAARIGSETSSRNSEVIHAGLYYHPESLKAELCVAGRRLLYRYCRDRRVAYRQCGKLVVATEPREDAYLGCLLQRAQQNGVEDIELIGAARLKRLEPQVRGTSALLSPCSGIVDSHALMLAYQADAEAAGVTIAFHTAGPRGNHCRPHDRAKDRRERIDGSRDRSRDQRRRSRRLGLLGRYRRA